VCDDWTIDLVADSCKQTRANTKPRVYCTAERPPVIIRIREKEEPYLTHINTKTAYFRGPHYVS